MKEQIQLILYKRLLSPRNEYIININQETFNKYIKKKIDFLAIANLIVCLDCRSHNGGDKNKLI